MIRAGVMVVVGLLLLTGCEPRPPCGPRMLDGPEGCRCEPGYAPEGDECAEVPTWTCDTQHRFGDHAEPDECPPLAFKLPADLTELHTIAPAGDHDWYELRVTAGRIVQFTASSFTTQLLVDVFDETGLQLIASDNRGSREALVGFVAPRTGAVMVRVRALRATDEGAYEPTYLERGVDDFVNEPEGAVTISPAASPFTGEVQYPGDVDVVRLELPARTAVSLSRMDPDAGIELELSRPGGGRRVLLASERTTVTTREVEPLVLLARATNGRSVGAFKLAMSALGPDDFSDEPAFAHPIAPDAASIRVVHERAGDADTFLVPQEPGRLYRASWPNESTTRRISVLTEEGVEVTSVASATGLTWRTFEGPAVLSLSASSGALPQAFELTVRDLGVEDQDGDVPRPLEVGTPTRGRLELLGDVDVFSFPATSGHIYSALVTVTSARADPVRVQLLDAFGASVGSNGVAASGIPRPGVALVQVNRLGGARELLEYTITITDEGPDDHGTGPRATPLVIGAATTGVLQYVGDEDGFTFTPEARHLYRVECSRPAFRVRDARGVQRLQVGTSPAVGHFYAAEGFAWSLEVFQQSSGAVLGPFTLTVTDLGVEDHGDARATATPLTLGTAVSGELSFANDVDGFSFAASPGRIYRVAATSSAELRLEVRDGADATVPTVVTGNTAVVYAAAGGTFLVRVSAAVVSSVVSSYSVVITDEGVDDHGNTAASSTALALGSPMTGTVQYRDDVDAFTLPVVARRHHRVQTTSPMVPCSITVEVGGAVIASAPGTTSNSVTFTPATGVTSVTVKIGCSGVSPFELVAAELTDDDHGDLVAEATPLVLDGAAVSGAIGVPGDVDQFTVTAPAGEIVVVTCTTSSGSACGLVVQEDGAPWVSLEAAAQRSTAVLTNGGQLELAVRSNGLATGAYTIAVARGSDDLTTPRPLTLGTAVSGRIDHLGDEDTFTVALTSSVSVQLTVTGTVEADLLTPTGAFALVLGGSPPGRVYSPPVSGTFTIRVRRAFNGPLASYSVLVQ